MNSHAFDRKIDHARQLLIAMVRESYSIDRLTHALDDERCTVSTTLNRLSLAQLGALIDNAHDPAFVLPNTAGA